MKNMARFPLVLVHCAKCLAVCVCVRVPLIGIILEHLCIQNSVACIYSTVWLLHSFYSVGESAHTHARRTDKGRAQQTNKERNILDRIL